MVHLLQLSLYSPSDAAQMDSRRVFQLLDALGDELDLDSKGFVLFIIHLLLVDEVEEDGHPSFQSFQTSILRTFLHLSFVVEVDPSFFFVHSFEFLLKFDLFQFSPFIVSFLALLWIIEVVLQFLDFYLFLLVFGGLQFKVPLVVDELLHPELEHVVHCWIK